MLDLWLVRHAESIGNLDGTAADTDLSERGIEQASAIAKFLSPVTFASTWSSPLLRARQTAALALPDATPIIDARLSELRTGTAPAFVDVSDPVELDRLLRTKSEAGESGKAFMARVADWCGGLPSDGSVVAFTHFGVVREILAAHLGFRRAPQTMGYAAIFRLAISAGVAEVITWNQVG